MGRRPAAYRQAQTQNPRPHSREFQMSDIKAAGVLIYVIEKKEPSFLLLRSAKTGEWGPPKGKAEPGETELETAVRETYEETGFRRLQFVDGFQERIAYEVEKKGERKSKEVVFFLASTEEEDLKLSPEHTEAHLATFAEIEQLVPYFDVRELFEKAAKRLKG